MWNNQLRPFCSLKKRVPNIFRKRNSISDDSRDSSLQSVINYMEREESEEGTVLTEGKGDSVHLDWSDLIMIDVEAEYRKKDLIINLMYLLLLLLSQMIQFYPLPQLNHVKQLERLCWFLINQNQMNGEAGE